MKSYKLLKNSNEGTAEIDSFLTPKGRSYSKVNGFQDENFILTVEEATIRKKKVGIDAPFQMSINEIAENEGISSNKVKYSITNTLKIIEKNISETDRKNIMELLR